MALGTTYLYRAGARLLEDQEVPCPLYSAQVARERGWITDRDLAMLGELAQARFLTRSQVRTLGFANSLSDSTTRRRLESLLRQGVIRRRCWEVPGAPPRCHYAYSLSLTGAQLLREHYGRSTSWKPGMGKCDLRSMLQILAANEFQLQIMKELPLILGDWEFCPRSGGPVASFTAGGQLFLLDVPRDEQDVLLIRAERYAQWREQNPVILTIAPSEGLAAEIFERLAQTMPTERLLFTTDERAFECALTQTGYLWRWRHDGSLEPLALLEVTPTRTG